ncbi:MAG: patatin-like phospholipase family protein [Actinomycetota bacterium]
MKRGLVLGGGGLVGMGYHAGALEALAEWGIDPAGSDVIVGTSAGSIMGSYLAAGWTPQDFFDYALGRHRDSVGDEGRQDEVRRIFVPLSHGPGERIRRSIGSLFAAAASRGYWRPGAAGRLPPQQLRRLFPAGLYSTDETRARLRTDLPEGWPRAGLFICAVNLYSGKRVAFGAEGAPEVGLPDAVLASTAIPGVFPPVRIGRNHYVDGGVYSATSLDLAMEAGCETILCIAPLGYRKESPAMVLDPKLWPPMVLRQLFARALKREVGQARARGAEVFVIRPWLTDLASHGTNSMRYFDRAALVEAARAGTLRMLEQNAGHPALTPTSERRAGAADG